MRHAQLITYGLDDDAAERLHAVVQSRGIGLRVTRHVTACLSVLRQGAAGVLVLRIGRDLEAEFSLLAQAALLFPRVAPVVWGDADLPRLAGLAWDLGARGVIMTAQEVDRLHDLIGRLLGE